MDARLLRRDAGTAAARGYERYCLPDAINDACVAKATENFAARKNRGAPWRKDWAKT